MQVAKLALFPKDIIGTIFSDKPSIAEIAVMLRGPDPTQSLAEVVNALSLLGAKVLTLNFTSEDTRQFITAFIDYSGVKGGLSWLARELRRVRGVGEVRYRAKRIREKIIDGFATPTFNRGRAPAMVLSREELGRVFSEVKERYGSGGEAFLYHIGRELGEVSGEKYRGREVGEEFIREDILSFQAFGWGVPKVVELNLSRPRIRLRFYDLFESSVVKGEKSEPYCHFFRGYLAGLFSRFLGTRVEVMETKCIAKGDPYCEFIVE